MDTVSLIEERRLLDLYNEFVITHRFELLQLRRDLISYRVAYNRARDCYEIVFEAENPVMVGPPASQVVAPLESGG